MMKKFIIVNKTVQSADLSKDRYKDIMVLLPSDTPYEMAERSYKNLAEAKADNPGLEVMTVQAYEGQQNALRVSHGHAFGALKLRHREIALEIELGII